MVFSSPIFLFWFLPLTLVLTIMAIHIRLRNFVLLLASLLFYAWGEGSLVILMLASITFNYIFGLLIGNTTQKRKRRSWLITGIVFNIGLLFYFKYFNFSIDNLNFIINRFGLNGIAVDPVHLPIGISFFTFQSMSYIIDVYRKKTTHQKNPLDIALYISLFPQLIAGPIVRYHDIAQQIKERSINIDLFASGVKRFIEGLGKKVLIANTMAWVADKIFAIPAQELTTELSWLGIIAYTLQIYFDFSGYSDMAIGLGRMFGFRILENFNFPYISQSLREFWTRWHISLTNWFRDYLFIPLALVVSGKFKSNKVFNIKSDVWIYIISMLVTWYLIGMWHGANWSFIAWGLLNGFFIVIERFFYSKRLKKTYRPIRHIYTLLVITIAWVFFRAETFDYAFAFIGSMFGFASGTRTIYFIQMYLNNEVYLAIIFGVVFSMPVTRFLKEWYRKKFLLKKGNLQTIVYHLVSLLQLGVYALILVFSSMSLAAGTYNPFIYFRF
ncbi:MBOAT family O-acyltransferase [Bacteroidota bacterium]